MSVTFSWKLCSSRFTPGQTLPRCSAENQAPLLPLQTPLLRKPAKSQLLPWSCSRHHPTGYLRPNP